MARKKPPPDGWTVSIQPNDPKRGVPRGQTPFGTPDNSYSTKGSQSSSSMQSLISISRLGLVCDESGST